MLLNKAGEEFSSWMHIEFKKIVYIIKMHFMSYNVKSICRVLIANVGSLSVAHWVAGIR